jgi:hypothetical protein
MKYKTQFRLGIKGVALITFLITSPILLYIIMLAISLFIQGTGMFFSWTDLLIPFALSLPTVLSIYVFFRPNLIVNLAIPSNKPYCPECGYPLTKPIPNHCSECGTALPNDLVGAVNQSDTSTGEDD